MSNNEQHFRLRYEREKKARLEAERLLEEKSDELYESLLQVRSSGELLQSAMDSMAEGLLLIDHSGCLVLANEQIKKIYPQLKVNLEPGLPLGGKLPKLLRHPEYLLAKRNSLEETTFELFLEKRRTIAVSVRLTKENLISTTHRDITELKENEEERRQLLVDLLKAQRMEAIGRMSSMIAHDFNNILASVMGYAGFLDEDLMGQDKLQTYAKKILAATDKANDLIQRILETSEDKVRSAQPVSLIPVIDDCIEMIEATLSEKVDIHFQPLETPIWVQADENRLHQLFMNLLSNAGRAIGAYSGAILIEIIYMDSINLKQMTDTIRAFNKEAVSKLYTGITEHTLPSVMVSITDSGEGITPESMAKIFDMYFTTRSSDSTGGVGLASVLDILDDYHGGIRCLSIPGVATQIDVVFPVSEFETELVNLNERISHKLDVTMINKDSILVIDDDVSVGHMIQNMIERTGYEVQFMSSGLEALKELRKDASRWGVVVSDQIMPEIKGTEIFRQLREEKIGIPFILCTGQVDEASKEFAGNLEGSIVKKPVDRESLLSQISRCLIKNI